MQAKYYSLNCILNYQRHCQERIYVMINSNINLSNDPAPKITGVKLFQTGKKARRLSLEGSVQSNKSIKLHMN